MNKKTKIDIDIITNINRILDWVDTLPKAVRYLMSPILIILGITGLILPIMPGWIFLIPGISIISPKFSKLLKTKLQNYTDWRNNT